MLRTPRPDGLPTKHEIASAAYDVGELHRDAARWAIRYAQGAEAWPPVPANYVSDSWRLISQRAASARIIIQRLWEIGEAYATTFDITVRLAMADVRIVTRAGAVQCVICRRAHPCELRHKDDCAYLAAAEWATKLSEEALTQDYAGAGVS